MQHRLRGGERAVRDGRCGAGTGTRPRWEGLALTAFSSMRLTSFTCVSVSPEFKREFSRN